MALDEAYFDAIQIDVVKKKYYNANKVEAVLSDIRRQALELTAENERLREQTAEYSGRRDEIGDTLLSAKTIARQILQEAQAKADELVTEAESRAREITAAAEERAKTLREEELAGQRATVQRMEACYSRVREQLLNCVDDLNTDWQEYLCQLDIGGENTPPADLDEKLGRIAQEIFALDGEEHIEAESFEA